MNVLVACEESQAVCNAFREKGHNAFSCDIQECSGGHPEWHIVGDCLGLINGNCEFKTQSGTYHRIFGKWDLIIAHPPCTYMSNAGACRMYPTKGNIDKDRLAKGLEAKEFFLKIYNADCDNICIENPKPLKVIGLPQCTQIIQPYQFGHPYSKPTMLWLKGLNKLEYTNVLQEHKPFIPCGTQKHRGTDYNKGTKYGSKERSKTFSGIAQAMADQWGGNE